MGKLSPAWRRFWGIQPGELVPRVRMLGRRRRMGSSVPAHTAAACSRAIVSGASHPIARAEPALEKRAGRSILLIRRSCIARSSSMPLRAHIVAGVQRGNDREKPPLATAFC